MTLSVTLCPIEVIPENGGRQFRVDGREVAVFRVGGRVFALDGICPHQGGPLGFGEIVGEKVLCPWHGWPFDLATGHCDPAPESSVAALAVRVEDGMVILDLD
jgi:nitrite reductase (NADH) small subunit